MIVTTVPRVSEGDEDLTAKHDEDNELDGSENCGYCSLVPFFYEDDTMCSTQAWYEDTSSLTTRDIYDFGNGPGEAFNIALAKFGCGTDRIGADLKNIPKRCLRMLKLVACADDDTKSSNNQGQEEPPHQITAAAMPPNVVEHPELVESLIDVPQEDSCSGTVLHLKQPYDARDPVEEERYPSIEIFIKS